MHKDVLLLLSGTVPDEGSWARGSSLDERLRCTEGVFGSCLAAPRLRQKRLTIADSAFAAAAAAERSGLLMNLQCGWPRSESFAKPA